MAYHCFGDVGIWASLGKHENLNHRFKISCKIVMRAEHKNWHEIVMHAEQEKLNWRFKISWKIVMRTEHEKLNRWFKNRNDESGVI